MSAFYAGTPENCSDSLALVLLKSHLNDIFVETMTLRQTVWLTYQAADPRIAGAEPHKPPLGCLLPNLQHLCQQVLETARTPPPWAWQWAEKELRPKHSRVQRHTAQTNRRRDEQNRCLHVSVAISYNDKKTVLWEAMTIQNFILGT